jgi:Peptidase_C39 like family
VVPDRSIEPVPIVTTMNNRLDVDYFAQCDNEWWAESDGYMVSGTVQCAATSNAMLLNYLKPELMSQSIAKGFTEFESYYKARFNSLGYSADDRGNHDCHTETLRTFGIDTQWRTDLTDADIAKSLSNKFPVVAGFVYKVAGHICVIVGRTDAGYLVHDPYGLRTGSRDEYSYINPGFGDTSGAYDLFRWANLDVTLFNGNSKKDGAWGRILTGFNP